MAHHRDAKKRIRQTEKRTLLNKSARTNYRNQIKAVRAAIEAGDREGAQATLKKAIVAIDRAVTKDVLRKQTASRYKSRLTRAVAGLAA